jgi:hypothetical protein
LEKIKSINTKKEFASKREVFLASNNYRDKVSKNMMECYDKWQRNTLRQKD